MVLGGFTLLSRSVHSRVFALYFAGQVEWARAAVESPRRSSHGTRMSADDASPAPAPVTAPEPVTGPSPPPEDLPMGALRPPRRFPRLAILLGAVAALLLLAGVAGWQFWSGWNAQGVLEPRGGLYFVRRTTLEVPSFRQGDPRWREDFLGPTDGTLGAEGCAVSSAAMVLSYYGVDTDPQRLNTFLSEREGYTPQGWIYWEKAAELAPGKVRHAYEDLGSYRLLDENLWRGNPVIVKLRLQSGTTHFVVVAGKDGFEYLTQDPGAGAARGLYPLSELGSKIEGLRFYEKL
jgi:hypothetical protein